MRTLVKDILLVATWLVCLTWTPPLAAQGAASDAKALEGIWTGAWGRGRRDGVVFQPVVAELFIKGDQIELAGFRETLKLVGTLRVDTAARRLHVTPIIEPGQPAPKALSYSYELKDDVLTLTGSEKTSIAFQ